MKRQIQKRLMPLPFQALDGQRIIVALDIGIDMEAERINNIGNLLNDLQARTLDLRGYL
jgi:hypothetical protein